MKIRAKKTIYYLPRIHEGQYSQADIDRLLSWKITEGDIFVKTEGDFFRNETNTNDTNEWYFGTYDLANFDILEA